MNDKYPQIPDGQYFVKIYNAQVAPLKKDGTNALKITFNIISGDYINNKIFDTFCLRHTSHKKRYVDMDRYKDFLQALGDLPVSTKPEEFINRNLTVWIKNNGDWTNVTNYGVIPKPATGV